MYREATGRPPRAVPVACYEGPPLMDLWIELERLVRERGFRVEARLQLLARLRDGEDPAEDVDALLDRIREAAQALKTEAAG